MGDRAKQMGHFALLESMHAFQKSLNYQTQNRRIGSYCGIKSFADSLKKRATQVGAMRERNQFEADIYATPVMYINTEANTRDLPRSVVSEQ